MDPNLTASLENGNSQPTFCNSSLESSACQGNDRTPKRGRASIHLQEAAKGNADQEHSGGLNADLCLSAFSRLPDEVIERILYAVDANVFASLVLLNKKWRSIASCSELYYHHLLGCRVPGSATLDPASRLSPSDHLEILRSRFAREARRNAFDVFLRPKRTLVNLISASASSSSAFPQGEAFRFEFSANGRRLLALSSSRMFVLDLTTDPISIRHDLKTSRRPLTAVIGDEGNILAMVSSEHQAHIYTLTDTHAELIQSIVLSEVPRTLAFSPDAAVLAVAYSGGIEVYAIGENVLCTARRAVRCSGVDFLTFCCQGSMLLGTSNNPRNSDIVTISPPLFPDYNAELTSPETESRMWTTQMLFPQIQNGYSHAALIPSPKGGDGSPWFSGYNLSTNAFRLAPVNDPNSNAIFLVGPGADIEGDEPKPHILPAASRNAELLAVGFHESQLWLYGIPHLAEQSSNDTSLENNSNLQEKEPVWRSNSTTTNFSRLKKTIDGPKKFVHGTPVRLPDGVCAINWVHNSNVEGTYSHALCRLVAVAPGGVSSWLGASTGDMLPIDGGRIMIFDFEYSASNGEQTEMTIELGDLEPIKLPEPGSDLDQEVELERRRTTMNRHRRLGEGQSPSSSQPPRGVWRTQNLQPESAADRSMEHLALIENPYNNSAPRSRDTLNRAATAASNRLDPRYHNARQIQSGIGRPRFNVPHESDADNWVPPPPPYTPKPDAPLPEDLQRSLLPSSHAQQVAADNNINANGAQPQRSVASRLEAVVQEVVQRSSTRAYRGSENRGLVLPTTAPQSPPPNPYPEVFQSARPYTNDLASINSVLTPSTAPPSRQHPVAASTPVQTGHVEVQISSLVGGPREYQERTAAFNRSISSVVDNQRSVLPTIQHLDTNIPTSNSPRTASTVGSSANILPFRATAAESGIRPSGYDIERFHRPVSHGNPVASSLAGHEHTSTVSQNHPLSPSNHNCDRSRSRSQDAPRLLSTSGWRTGRGRLATQPGVEGGRRSQSDNWLTQRSSQKKDSRCVVM